jgi:hypothetical protein
MSQRFSDTGESRRPAENCLGSGAGDPLHRFCRRPGDGARRVDPHARLHGRLGGHPVRRAAEPHGSGLVAHRRPSGVGAGGRELSPVDSGSVGRRGAGGGPIPVRDAFPPLPASARRSDHAGGSARRRERRRLGLSISADAFGPEPGRTADPGPCPPSASPGLWSRRPSFGHTVSRPASRSNGWVSTRMISGPPCMI